MCYFISRCSTCGTGKRALCGDTPVQFSCCIVFVVYDECATVWHQNSVCIVVITSFVYYYTHVSPNPVQDYRGCKCNCLLVSIFMVTMTSNFNSPFQDLWKCGYCNLFLVRIRIFHCITYSVFAKEYFSIILPVYFIPSIFEQTNCPLGSFFFCSYIFRQCQICYWIHFIQSIRTVPDLVFYTRSLWVIFRFS